VPTFGGWLSVYEQPGSDRAEPDPAVDQPAGSEGEEEATTGLLPKLTAGDRLELRKVNPEQKFTQPAPRFSEATLVKELEENGIGRPTTYASIIGVLQTREYAEKVEGRFRPTRLGRLVLDLLVKSFDDILAVDYTRGLEEQLDKIADGEADYRTILTSFYEKFSADLGAAAETMPNIKTDGLPSDETCDTCGSPMVVKVGRFGVFLACSAYPECTNTRELEKTESDTDAEPEACENCGKPMVVKRGRFGQFLACSGYPDCKTTRKLIESKGGLTAAKPDQLLDEKCPRCDSNLVVKQGRFGEFTACSNYPKCRYVKLKSTGVACPKDGGDIVERKSKRGRVFYGCNNYPDCDFTLWNRPLAESCPTCGAPYLVEKITKRSGHQVCCNNDTCDYARTEEAASA